MSKDLKAKFGFKALKADKKTSVVSLEDMEPPEFSSMREAARAISMGERVIRHERNNGRDLVKRFEDGSVGCFP